jgi:hypothetical protein
MTPKDNTQAAGGPIQARRQAAAQATQRLLVDVRCGAAEAAVRAADESLARVFEELRRHDEELALLNAAEAEWTPERIKVAKEEAHKAFQAAMAVASDKTAVDAAGAAWLAEINRINRRTGSSDDSLRRRREGAEAIMAEVDRLCAEAAANRARAEEAVAACREARREYERLGGRDLPPVPSALANFDTGRGAVPRDAREALALANGVTAADAPEPPAPEPPAPAEVVPAPAKGPGRSIRLGRRGRVAVALTPDGEEGGVTGRPLSEEVSETGEVGEGAEPLLVPRRTQRPQIVLRLLSGDPSVRAALAARLGADPGSRAEWQALLARFVDEAALAAIESGWLAFPPDHPFWSQLSSEQARGVVASLVGLGFRPNGRGGWENDRVPARRELALAVGSTGLLPHRVRTWPEPREMPGLLRDAPIAVDGLFRAAAPGLSLGEVVGALGTHAEPLADLWNAWDAVQPLLLSFDV